jgi:hypothetical protein
MKALFGIPFDPFATNELTALHLPIKYTIIGFNYIIHQHYGHWLIGFSSPFVQRGMREMFFEHSRQPCSFV